MTSVGTRHVHTSIAGYATVTGAGNCDVRALHCHAANPATVWSAQSRSEPRLRHSRKSKVRSLGSSVSVDRSDLLRFAAVTRWAAGRA
jgi:hypothetical protein